MKCLIYNNLRILYTQMNQFKYKDYVALRNKLSLGKVKAGAMYLQPKAVALII